MQRGKSNSKPYYWSPTGLEAYERCERQWFFNQGNDITNGDLALGIFTHQKISSLRVNPKYTSAEKWANACIGDWKRRIIKEGKIRGQFITWKTIDKPDDEKWLIISRIKRICTDNYDRLMSESAPIFFPSNNRYKKTIEFKVKPFYFEGRGFRGDMDEIRIDPENGFPVIRDYKTGFRGYLERRINYKFQPAFYNFFICIQAYKDPRFRSLIGIPDEIAKKWAGNPVYIDQRIKLEYYMLENHRVRNPDGSYQVDEKGRYIYEIKNPSMVTTRSDKDYAELCQKIDKASRGRLAVELSHEYVASKDTHCEWCNFRKQCAEMTENLPVKPKQVWFLPLEYHIMGVYGKSIAKEAIPFIPQNSPHLPKEIPCKQLTFDFPRKKRKKKPSVSQESWPPK